MKQDADMALCDQCFWERHPHTAFGPVMERRKAQEIKTPPPATKPAGATGQEPARSTCKETSMDPDVALMKLLEGAEALAEGEMTHNEAEQFAIQFENLHEWMVKDGFAPAAWGDPEAKLLQWLLLQRKVLVLGSTDQIAEWLALPVAERPWRNQK